LAQYISGNKKGSPTQTNRILKGTFLMLSDGIAVGGTAILQQ
jgi:hypothetical protein